MEKTYENQLRGKRGGRQVEVDARGRVVDVLKTVASQPGNNLYLTIDQSLQERAEALLDGHAGAVAILDPSNGQILAMASSPSFDQNDFVDGMSHEQWNKLISNPRRPMENKVIQAEYPPASTYKIITALAGLADGVISPSTTFFCPGQYRFGNRVYRCWKKGGHGRLNVVEAMEQSCDVFFYQTGQKLGVDRLAWHARASGLGSPTGVELDHEASGLIPTAEWKKRRTGESWQRGETLSIAIGQGYNLATPLQMAVMISAVGNGGRLFKPQIIRRIEGADGSHVKVQEPEMLGTLPVDPATLALVQEGLWRVVNGARGTARKIRIEGIDICGKTGTAQVFSRKKNEDNTETPDEDPPETPRLVRGLCTGQEPAYRRCRHRRARGTRVQCRGAHRRGTHSGLPDARGRRPSHRRKHDPQQRTVGYRRAETGQPHPQSARGEIRDPMMFDRRLAHYFDWILLGLVLVLGGIGLVALYSAVNAGTDTLQQSLYYKQMIWFGVGLAVMVVCFLVDYKRLEQWAHFFYGGCIALLVAVMWFGKYVGGSKRWLVLGPVSFQPSELAKIAVIIVLARYYAKVVNPRGLTLREMVHPIAMTLLPFFLIVQQPDLGTAMLLALIAVSMTVYLKIRRGDFAVVVVSCAVAIPLVWNLLKGYQKQRILTFLDPGRDPLGAGYHVIQSKIAIGSGMLTGKGFLQGTQNALAFLPEQHTDFIFSVLAEEWGFFGSLSLLAAFLVLIIWGLNIAQKCRDPFGTILSVGVTAMIFWQVFINIGMVMGLMPVVGVPLPFISYGGSSILAMMFCVGLLLNVSMRRFMVK